MSEILLTIVVPVYNVQDYIEDCIESIVQQGLVEKEYEIICVDDGSTDTSGAIIDRLSGFHSNIQCVHQQNKGVSSARNKGIELARGKFIYFIDGDDFLRSGALSSVIKRVTVNNLESASFGFREVEESEHFRVEPALSSNGLSATWGGIRHHIPGISGGSFSR